MSTVLTNPTQSTQERSVEATTRLREALGFAELSSAELKCLNMALAEAAAEEILKNPDFERQVRMRYDELRPKKQSSKKPIKKKTVAEVLAADDLVPVNYNIQHDFDPYAPPDAHFLLQLYGSHQLEKALNRYPPSALKETAALLMAEHPGAKPTSKAKKDALIAYIVEIVTTRH